MKISKVLNNNVVITTDEKQNEIIVMGRGIAFKKKVGDDISDQTIDKVYRLENRTIASQFQELLADLPLEYLELSNQVIEYAREELSSPINDSIYISLPDHLHSAIERAKKGIVVKNVLLWDIKRFFPDEFKIGKRTIEKISERYGIELPEDEAGFIALHLVNAQTENNDQSNLYELTKTMQDTSISSNTILKQLSMKNRFIFIVLLRICVFLFPACRTTLPMRKRLTMSSLRW